MEHLKPLFHGELADLESGQVQLDDGKIVIGSRRWAPGDLLQALGEEIYSDVFANWVAERQQRMLERADEILDQYEQADRFEALRKAYRAGMVSPFIGAGMSMPSAYPGWTGFLHRVRRQTAMTEQHLTDLLDAGEYERAAQGLADAFGVAFDEQVEAAFGRDRELRGPIQLIPFLFTTPVATTNFDDVVRRCYDGCRRPFEEIITGVDADEVQRLMSAGQRVLVKLHGSARTGRGRVLTAHEYETVYGGDKIDRVIRALCTRTLLFMGCRLTIDRTLTAIRGFVAAQGHSRVPRHYAFLAASEDAAERLARAAALAQLNIYPIWYPAQTDDESIEALLYRLANGIVPL